MSVNFVKEIRNFVKFPYRWGCPSHSKRSSIRRRNCCKLGCVPSWYSAKSKVWNPNHQKSSVAGFKLLTWYCIVRFGGDEECKLVAWKVAAIKHLIVCLKHWWCVSSRWKKKVRGLVPGLWASNNSTWCETPQVKLLLVMIRVVILVINNVLDLLTWF